jgi:hypothetical protein
MGFGQGNTGLIVAAVVSLSSGLAFVICFREFTRELFSRSAPRIEKSLRRNRNILLDQGGEFVVEDQIFTQLLDQRNAAAQTGRREWQDPTSYLMTMAFLGLVSAAGFLAGLSHFA